MTSNKAELRTEINRLRAEILGWRDEYSKVSKPTRQLFNEVNKTVGKLLYTLDTFEQELPYINEPQI